MAASSIREDFRRCWQQFEAEIQSYAGDDPLDLWDRFIQWAEPLLPPTEKDELVSVLEKLVKNFMNVKKYSNDPRYVNYLLKLINCSTTPLEFFNYMDGQGIGTKSAAFYLAWAEVLEMNGNALMANSILQKGIQNSAEPLDLLVHHYRNFTARDSQNLLPVQMDNSIKSAAMSLANQQSMPLAAQDGFKPEPLGNSQLINQDSAGLSKLNLNAVPAGIEALPKSQGNIENDSSWKQSTFNSYVTESRALNSVASAPVHQTSCKMQEISSELQQVVMYDKSALFSGDKEMCFEEIRAQKHIAQSQQTEQEEWKEMFNNTKSDEIRSLEQKLEQLKMQLKLTQEREQEILQISSQSALELVTAPSPLPTKPDTQSIATALPMEMDSRGETKRNLSSSTCAGTVVTASFTDATLQSSQHSTSLSVAKRDIKQRSSEIQPCFQIFGEPENGLNNFRAQLEQPSRSVVTSANNSSSGQQLMNESANSSRMTSFTRPKEGNLSGLTMNRSHTPNSSFGIIQATPSRVLPSPTVCTKEALDVIMDMFQAPVIPELSQVNENISAFVEDQMEVQDGDFGTYCKKDNIHQSLEIVGMNIAPPSTVPFSIFEDDGAVNSINNTQTSKPIVSRPLGELSDRQITKEINEQAIWAVCDNKTLTINPNVTEGFTFPAPLASTPFYGVPQCPKRDSEECSESNVPFYGEGQQENPQIKDHEFSVLRSSEEECIQHAKLRKYSSVQDLGFEPISHLTDPAFVLGINRNSSSELPISEEFQVVEKRLESCTLLSPEEECLKPEQSFCCLKEMHCSDLQFDEEPNETPNETGVIIKNPWDKNLIDELLSNLTKPLSSYASFKTCKDNMPAVRPRSNIHLGNEMYQVSYLLGEGSFAHVYQASVLDMKNLSDLKNQQKVSLKVQKISSPWEFYINTQLSERLKPTFRSLYNTIHSGHFFNNGCILVGELYSFGTLLNAVNLYKTLVEKTMPQPLVIYFAIHILYMVEQLHTIGIIHGDIKPDNFILGERFLDSDTASVDDSLSQGLTLIDFGQSIDMNLFPKNAVFVENCKTSGFQCIEMLSEKPWTFQVDYFGIAATVYCLLFGTYLKLKKENGVWKVNANFKRGHHKEVWNNLFNTLVYIPNCQNLPSLRDLREELVALFKEHYSKKLKSLRQQLMVLLLEKKHSQRRI
ncbi:mitotic checkpoint serine/threonine-protein kinase BUB1 [Hemitrygon akajei]|uniref:mitotic checkpoint serine/threonine-protein kinase BUB1 n=1 Tax=Hemitrygon akajei TaxID=2704970 RepID=UPI003BF9F07C